MTKRIVFFDLDGTILDGLSSERSFFLYLFFNAHLSFGRLLNYFLFFFKWAPKYHKFVVVRNKAYLSGLEQKKVEKLAEKFVKEKLMKRVRARLIERIELHRRDGDMIVLLTGAPYFLANVFAKYLNIKHVEATICATSTKHFLSDPPLQYPYDAEKLEIAERVCKKQKVDIKDCAAYGNSIRDAILLDAVGKAVAVTPDKKLKKLAQEKDWEIIEYRCY